MYGMSVWRCLLNFLNTYEGNSRRRFLICYSYQGPSILWLLRYLTVTIDDLIVVCHVDTCGQGQSYFQVSTTTDLQSKWTKLSHTWYGFGLKRCKQRFLFSLIHHQYNVAEVSNDRRYTAKPTVHLVSSSVWECLLATGGLQCISPRFSQFPPTRMLHGHRVSKMPSSMYSINIWINKYWVGRVLNNRIEANWWTDIHVHSTLQNRN